jgi:outer membrane receptor protein involved in Fe transport
MKLTKLLIVGAAFSYAALASATPNEELLKQLRALSPEERATLLKALESPPPAATRAVTPAAASAAAPAAAPEAEDETLFMMDAFVVNTASRKDESIRDAASNIVVVGQKQIKEWGSRDLNDVLRRVSGYTVVYDRDEIVYAARGNVSDNNQKYLILIDGHSMNSTENFGPGNVIELPNDLSNVKQIEVIKGPGSVVWGAGALAGVINIRTLEAGDLKGHTQGSISYGTNNTVTANFQTGIEVSDISSILIMGAYASSSGETVEQTAATGFPIPNSTPVPAGWPRKFTTSMGEMEPSYMLQMKANVGEFKINAYTMYSSIFNRQFEEGFGRTNWLTNQKYFLEGSYNAELDDATDWGWKVSTHHNRSEYLPDLYDQPTVRANNGGVDKFPTNISWLDNNIKLNAFIAHEYGEQLSVDAGLELAFARNGPSHRINNINPENPTSTTGTTGFWLDEYNEESAYGGYLLGTYSPTEAVKLVAGAWVDYNADRGNDAFNFSPRLGAIWQASEKTTLKLLYNRAFLRPANFQTVNNDVIESETMQQYDLIWIQEFSPFTLTVNAFYQELDGFINIVSIGTASRFENAGTYESTGVEIDLSANLTKDLSVWGNLSYAQAESSDFPPGLPLDSRRILPDGQLLSYPELMANLGGTMRFADGKFFISPALRYMGDVWIRENTPVGSISSSTYTNLDATLLFDVNLGWEPNDRYGFYLNVVNALNEDAPTYQSVWNGTVGRSGLFVELTGTCRF